MVVLWLKVPPVPMTVKEYVPRAVDAPTFMVKVDVAEPSGAGVIEAGLKVPVVSAGNPDMVRPTSELKPFKDVTVMVEVPDPPKVIERDVGEAAIVKSGGAVTVRATVVL